MKHIVTLLLVAAGFQAIAQIDTVRQDTSKVLTYREAIQIALRNNLLLNQQRNNLYVTQTQKTSGIALLGPQISISGNVSRADGNNFVPQTGDQVNSVVDNASASLNAQMPLFNGLRYVNNMRSTVAAQDAQVEYVHRTTQDVMNFVSTQYLQVLLDQELVIIAKENVDVLRKQLSQAKAQVELGSRSPVDEYNQQALLSTAEIAMVQSEYTLANDKITLFQTLMVEPSATTVMEEPSWDINTLALDNVDLEQMQSTAAQRRADLKQAEYLEKSYKYAMQSTKGNYFPSIVAFYSLGSNYNRVHGDTSALNLRTFNEQFRHDNRAENIGIRFNIPIFTAFQNRSTYVRARVQYENYQLTKKNTEVTVKGDVVRAFENFNNIKKNYSASVVGLDAARVAFNLEQERYNLGITSFVDLANATKTLVQAQTNMASAKYRFLFQKIMLDYATGTLKLEDLP